MQTVSPLNTIVQTLDEEIAHAHQVEEAFLRAKCLLEVHYQKQPSSVLEVEPDLDGLTITDAEAEEVNQTLIRFIETLPNHHEVANAIQMLALARDPQLKGFFITQLRLCLAWRNPNVVFQLLLALEDLGERIFKPSDGHPPGARSAYDTETNFGVARRYLERHDRTE